MCLFIYSSLSLFAPLHVIKLVEMSSISIMDTGGYVDRGGFSLSQTQTQTVIGSVMNLLMKGN